MALPFAVLPKFVQPPLLLRPHVVLRSLLLLRITSCSETAVVSLRHNALRAVVAASRQGFYKFVELDEAPSRALLREVMDVVTSVTFSHHWQVGDVLIWE